MRTKNDIRQATLKIRNALPAEIRRKKSEKILKTLESLPAFKKARRVLFYWSVGSEVETAESVEKFLEKKELYLPAVRDENVFHALRVESVETLKPGQKKVPEPVGGKEAEKLDVIIVPGVAFDAAGNRIGTGKGYYDRFLPGHPKAIKIGLAYEEQMVENIPADLYDVPVDCVITDRRLYSLPPPPWSNT